LIANLGVVAGIVFLAYEIQQNTVALEASSRQEFAAQDLAFLGTILDPSILATAVKKIEIGETLSELESSQLKHRQHLNFHIFENAYYQYQKGALEQAEWKRYLNIMDTVICRHPPAQSMWQEFSGMFEPNFAEIVGRSRSSCAQ
jgi:hypothetical protein